MLLKDSKNASYLCRACGLSAVGNSCCHIARVGTSPTASWLPAYARKIKAVNEHQVNLRHGGMGCFTEPLQ
jgi:hypothetical protein